jgi:tryptophan halogenase
VLHLQGDEGFDEHSWLAIHAGMQHWPERADPVVDELAPGDARAALQARRRAIADAVARLPAHDAYLARILKQPGA